MSAWLSSKGLESDADDWSVEFTLSNTKIENWFYKRNRLQPHDLKLSLVVPRWGLWVAQLQRHDRSFAVQWRPENGFHVDSQQLKYTRHVQWPALASLDDFPSLAGKLSLILDTEFQRHVNIGARSIDIKASLQDGSKLGEWLSPCADSLGRDMKA